MLDSPQNGNCLLIGTTAACDSANRLVQHWRRFWNGGLAPGEVASLFSPSVVLHFQDKTIVGPGHIASFAKVAARAVSGLDLVPVEIVSHEDRVLLYYYWTAGKWHSTILGANKRSNLCQTAFRVQEEKIVEVWQQAPDFIFLLGAPKDGSVMSYPRTLPSHRFARGEQGLERAEDAEMDRMCELFQMMNACALGGNPLRKVSDCMHQDVNFCFGGRDGRGIEAWKTFAWAMRTALGNLRPVLSDSLYIRENANTLSIYSRVTFDADSPFLLAGANGQVGSLKIQVRGGKIQSVYTCPENYIWFLGTDFTNHAARTRQLFQGKRVALAAKEESRMEQPGESRASLPGRDDVAVIGMAGRFPNADSVAGFWELLCRMQPAFSEFPDERAFLKQGTKIRHAALLDRVDAFDASFFNVPPVSVEYMDPQQRILMEVIWHSIEASAHRASEYAGPRTGLIVASVGDDYKKYLQDAGVPLNSHFWMGNEAAIFPAKIARFLNIQGTCKLVNAECSSSLFAIHEAMRLIRDGSHDQVIVGAANIFMHSYGFAVREDGLLSTEPRPFLFSAESSGQLRGEAAVAVILKSLKQAIEDKDEIYGVLSGSAVNNSGHTLSISAANVERQKDVILEAWRDASVGPSDISLIECHASGVREGDYAEVAAIRRALDGSGDSACSITSLKGCVGHAEAASGLSVLVKVLLQLRHRMIVGTVGAGSASGGQIDPALRMDPERLKVLVANTPWESSAQTRVAGINAFAGGGYNAHVVVREAPPAPARPNREPEPVIIVLSAKTEDGLRRLARLFQEYLRNPEVDLLDLAWTLQVGRDAMKHRAAFIGTSAADLIDGLAACSDGVTGRDGVYTGAQKPFQDAGAPGELVEELVANRNYARLAEVWCDGGIVPWEPLYTGKSVRRVSGLPLYPFARERYGIPPRKVESAETASQVLMARREWRRKSVFAGAKPLQYEQHCVFLCGDERLSAVRMEALLDGATCLRIEAGGEAALERRYLTCAAKLFEEVQRIFRDRKRGNCLIQLVCSGHDAAGIFVSLSALLRSARLEEPSIAGQVIEVDANESEEGCVQKLKENQRATADVEIRYRDGQREVFTLREAPQVLTPPEIPWRDGGVYLITGGRGRLALIFAREILRQTRNVTLVLTDLAPPDDAMRREFAALERAGSKIEYKQLDICDPHAVNSAIAFVIEQLGSLSGVIHMAGINRDRSILTKTTRDFEAVLSPKVSGTVYLDEATRDCALDFFVLFSSVAVLGNPGQTDYAAANGFLNSYAEHRDALVRSRRRSGRTLALNWPLWRAGGMQINDSKLKAMVEHTGIVPMETAAGINTFYQALAANQTECFVFGGDLARIRKCFLEAAGQTDQEDRFEVPKAPPGLTMMSPAWKVVTPVQASSFPAGGDRIVVFGGTRAQFGAIQEIYPGAESREIDSEESIDHLRESLKSIDHIVWIAPGGSPDSVRDESVIYALRRSLIHLFRIVKALGSGAAQRNLGWTVITEQGTACRSGEHVNPAHAAVHGMVGSAAKEYPHWRIRLLDLERGADWPVREIFSLPPDPGGHALVRRGKEWFRQILLPIRELSAGESPYRSQGVYVVIGGAGGIGEVWSRWMIQNYAAKIVWIGRRPADETIRARINALGAFGPPPVYIQADASNREALGRAYVKIKQTHAGIHGVVHSAVGSFDRSLAAMPEDHFLSVLSAKVDVSVRLAQVFADEPLKFILFFSSLVSFSKPGGMSGYSAGCAFMDAFARQLSQELPCIIKVMNWGYWNLGSGRAVSGNMKARLERQGMGAIEADEGMRSLTGLLSSPFDRMAVAKALRLEVIEELDQSEYVTVYPESLPGCIEQLPLRNPRSDARGRELIAQRAHEIDGMEDLALRILFGQLDVAGLMPDKVGARNIGFYGRWLNESFAFLQRGGYLSDAGPASPRCIGAVGLPSVWKEWEAAKRAWNTDPSKQATVALVEVCLRSLPEILLGHRPATSVMFPNSSMALVEGIYKDNLVSDYFNDVLADAVVAYVRKRLEEDPRTELRILEIGAGTGGSTASILARLETYRAHIAEYCYSDISNSFLFHAESRFLPTFPFVRTQLFDVGKPVEGQQLRAGGYDLAIATNVLHATRNIRRTLRNAKAALRTRGLLLLNEVSRKTLFAHLTFGLLEGWWLNEDDVLRIPGSPGLTPQGWRELLQDEGMSPVIFPVAAAHELGQQIVVAESDGVVRQERIEQAGKSPVARKQLMPARIAGSNEDDFNNRLHEKCVDYFKGLFARTLRMDAHKINPAEPLESYGMDSILIVQVTNAAREVLDDVTSALFFEFQTIDAVVNHFMTTQKSALVKLFKLESELAKEPGVTGRSAVREVASAPVRESSEPIRKPAAGQKRSAGAIAIIGVSGRFPQADTIERYWENLREGRDCAREIPRERWSIEGFYNPDPREAVARGQSYSKWGAFLDGIDRFDPLFFNLSPKEAELIDPQERLFLEEAWKALEDSGYAPSLLSDRVRERTGVFAGITRRGYALYMDEAARQLVSTSFASLANRVSYFMDLRGPSVAIDTMCSSSLVAIHQACQYLREGKGDLAIAGGVHLYVHPSSYVLLCASQFLSPHSRTPSFEENGSGFVPGECVGALILKPLELAIRDRDGIYALIPGSAVNQCGKTNAYGIPSSGRQAAVIQEALNIGAIDPRTIGYIEAAANGAQQSDAIEMLSLSMVFGNRNGIAGKSHIGSVKPNIGHSESASGIAQLSKVIMVLKHKTIPPTLIRGALNPEIQFDRLRFEIPGEAVEWNRLIVDGEQVPLRAGITSIGAGGVNAHVILEEFVPEPGTGSTAARGSTPVLFVLSAKSGDRLRAYAQDWSLYLSARPETDLERAACTLQLGREEMRHRLAIVCESHQELIEELDRWRHSGENSDRCFSADSKAIRYRIDDGVAAAIERRNLGDLAKLWVLGNTISWENLYSGEPPMRLNGLPTYPFSGKPFWIRPRHLGIEHQEPADRLSPRSEDNENTVAFYSILAEAAKPGGGEYLTFCPFPQILPGFSMTRVALNPAMYPEEAALVRDRQIELRQVLFCREDFNRIGSVLDIGCGHGTDIIQIAGLYPHLRVDGFTITRAQAALGNRRIAEKGLTSQARIFHKDSSKDRFPGSYDLVLGIEVSFHIRDKRALFENISSAMVNGGRVLLIDYIANLRGPIVDPAVGISIPARETWLELLSDHRFVIDEFIDLSPGIANYLHDPEFEDNIRSLPKVAQDTWRNYANQSTALAKGWISYCVLKVAKAADLDPQVCRARNEERLRTPQSYAEALATMRQSGSIPYPRPSEATMPHSARVLAPAISAGEIKKRLETIFCGVLGLEIAELRDAGNFRELGVGSVNAVELMEEINSRFDLRLPTSVVFEFHNLDALSSHLAGCIPAPKDSAPPPEEPIPKHAAPPSIGSSQWQTRSSRDDLAIVGISCRCAGANDANAFWEVLREGRDCIRDITDPDWLEFFRTHSSTPVPARYGAMEGADYFDPLFFGISPKEAESMDVSQRVLLQECYRALEDGGYSPSSLRGKSVGAFIGAVGKGSDNGDFSHFSLLGEETSILASRISYFLDLKGPALAIDTACSSSLVAIDLVCQALKNRSIDLAIAGGITIYNRPGAFVSMNNAGMLSPTGTCRPFDSEADGVVVGDGAGILILKRLEDAENDGDSVYAVIRGCGTNQDGKTSGLTVPSFLSQSQLQETVYRRAGVAVEDIQYVAAHGTATRLGDPIEIHALTHSFRQFTQSRNFCALGSIKANIGHTTAAAGVMNVIAAVLGLKNRQIPPSIHFSRANEHIEFEDSPFFVNEKLRDWQPNSSGSRMAAISSFGFSGTNAHMVLEEHSEPPGAASRSCESGAQLILISARDRDRLNEVARNLMQFIESEKALNLAEIAYTLQVGRDSMDERLGFVADSTADLLAKLAQFLEGSAVPGLTRGRAGRGSELRMAFTEDNELRQAAEKWMRQKKYSKLLELWVNGTVFDWEMLHHGEQKPRRIHLPGYPFARESFGRSRLESTKTFGLTDAPSRQSKTARHAFDESLHSDLLGRYAAKKIDFEGVMCLINGKPK